MKPLASGLIVRDADIGTGRRALRPSSPAVADFPSASAEQSTTDTDAERARARGYADGLRQGLLEAQDRMDEEIERHRMTLDDLAQRAERTRTAEFHRRVALLDGLLGATTRAAETQLDELEQQAIALAFEGLARILGQQDDTRARVLTDLVQAGMAQLRGAVALEVRLHPEDLDIVSSHCAGGARIGREAATRWIPDPALTRGDCRVRSGSGTLDIGLRTQLRRLADVWASGASERTD